MNRTSGSNNLPVMTIDLDGVVCRPLFGWNAGIHRSFLDHNAEAPTAHVWPRWLGSPLDHIRFDMRRPVQGATRSLSRLAKFRTLVLLTGRRSDPSHWLRWYGLDQFYSQIVINESSKNSPHHKLEQVKQLGAIEHVEDDGRTAQLLAELSDVKVYLRNWPQNQRLNLHRNVRRINDLDMLATIVEQYQDR